MRLLSWRNSFATPSFLHAVAPVIARVSPPSRRKRSTAGTRAGGVSRPAVHLIVSRGRRRRPSTRRSHHRPVLVGALGHPIVIENKPGAGRDRQRCTSRRQAGRYTARCLRADRVQHGARAQLPYDAVRDFPPCHRRHSPLLIVREPAVPAKDMRELSAYAKGQPARCNTRGARQLRPHVWECPRPQRWRASTCRYNGVAAALKDRPEDRCRC